MTGHRRGLQGKNEENPGKPAWPRDVDFGIVSCPLLVNDTRPLNFAVLRYNEAQTEGTRTKIWETS